ncbi:hypothetical protein V3Q90_15735, partial [Flavobacterium oreochromis]|uniref:hypothetical protein n=1 Tax=Flavobacterium oreochromis TaxID=2906078 RepID=UPI00385C4B37
GVQNEKIGATTDEDGSFYLPIKEEKMIKQFQRDYMKVPETGKVCGNVLRAIDEFQSKYVIDINQAKCKCKGCTGFGNGKYFKEKGDEKINEKTENMNILECTVQYYGHKERFNFIYQQ